ncbi:hypothetical protein [Chroococcidiopsis sp.]|uniref:hypothetical protein n=1 Tax=Chroococcidiopsis sp. TaxID=3088168 RepID=UPI003F3F608C
MRYYLDMCWNREGSVDIEKSRSVLKASNAQQIRLANLFGWSNQCQVLCFTANKETKQLIESLLPDYQILHHWCDRSPDYLRKHLKIGDVIQVKSKVEANYSRSYTGQSCEYPEQWLYHGMEATVRKVHCSAVQSGGFTRDEFVSVEFKGTPILWDKNQTDIWRASIDYTNIILVQEAEK